MAQNPSTRWALELGSPDVAWGNPQYRNVTCRQLRRGCLGRCRNMIGEVRRVEPGHHPGENIHGVVSSEDQYGQALKDNDEHRQPGEPASAQAATSVAAKTAIAVFPKRNNHWQRHRSPAKTEIRDSARWHSAGGAVKRVPA